MKLFAQAKPKTKKSAQPDERDERIFHLEEVNRTLKLTNDELSEEVRELREKVEILTTEVSDEVVQK